MTHCDDEGCGGGTATDEKVSGLRKRSGALTGAWEARWRAGFNRARVPGGQGGATAGGTEGDDCRGRAALPRITLRGRGVRGVRRPVPSVATGARGGSRSELDGVEHYKHAWREGASGAAAGRHARSERGQPRRGGRSGEREG